MYSAHLVLVCGIHVAFFNFCVCSTHEKDALYVQHVCCIYAYVQ